MKSLCRALFQSPAGFSYFVTCRKMLRLYRNDPAVAVTGHTSDLHLQYTVTCEAACDKILFEAL